MPPGYVQISLLHRMHLHLTSAILHHHLLCTLRDPPACLSFLRPKKKSNHNHRGPCFLFLQRSSVLPIRNERVNQSTENPQHHQQHQSPYATVFFFLLEIEEPLWQVPYGLTKASGGEFKVDVGEQTDSEAKKEKKKQSQFLLQPITTTNKTFGSITNAYSSKIDADSVILANL